MSASIRAWCDRAWTAAAGLPGGVGTDLRGRWETHAHRGEVVLTFFGPYDSGKSSLLKRLLVDDGQPIPAWLTVSGRRETFEPREAGVMGVVVRDTPGIAGGNELHEQAAKEAVALSDMMVLVLPPQIVTSDKEAIVAVMNGHRFGCAAGVAYAPQGLAVALSRMDEAGAMPRDDLGGYRDLLQRKRRELGELLHAQGVPDDVVAVHTLAADPFGLVGNRVPTGRAEYDTDRAWDGVAAFAEFLRGTSARKDELRLYGEVRFLGAELGAVASSLDQIHAEIRTAAEAATNEARAHAVVQERLKALLGAARADLDRRIEEEVSAAGRRGAADVSELRDAVLGRLEAALDRWSKEHDSALEVLVREADAEIKIRRERPAWKKLSDVLGGSRSEPEPAAGGKGPRESIDKVRRLTKALHKGFAEAQPAVIGMSLEKARNELQRLQQAVSFEEYARQSGRGATRLRDAAHAAQARRAVLLDVGLDVAVPALLELGGLVAEAWVEHRVAQQRAGRRDEVRRVVEDSSKKLAERAWTLWSDDGMPAVIDAALAELRASADVTASSLHAESANIAIALASLNKLLADLTTLPSPGRTR